MPFLRYFEIGELFQLRQTLRLFPQLAPYRALVSDEIVRRLASPQED